ncbi:hypothetical protein SRHO_G00128260 [Serrasalmus rhombeus]
MPDPRIPHTDIVALNRTVTSLVPYTNYSITILACSGGGGYVGGCTESLPTSVTTLPTIPQGLASLSVVAISESFLAVSWRPPSRPNGPNVRYELLRRKTQQPLASRPPEDFNRWYHVYAGDKLFHEDKGLSRYTWYEYQLLVHNDVGYASGEPAVGVTLAGPPHAPANVSALVLNHTAVLVNWTTPTLQDLQGRAELYFLTVNSSQESQTLRLDPSVTSFVISDLQPSTEYTLSLAVSNGAHSITSPEVTCTTTDGEPEGIFPPEIVTLNSTSVRVLWAAPLVPNGAVTRYSIYLDDQLYGSTDNTSGSLELGGLLPFTVYDIQVEVCTVYACVRSNSTKVTTVEDTPADIAAPHIQVLSSRSVRLEWTSPGQPNGIMGGYDIRRRALKPCEELQAKHAVLPQTHCSYVECPAHQDFCGSSCYDPEQQVCCGGTTHDFRDLHQCCDELYLPVVNTTMGVCCGGQLHEPLPHHQCCGGYYVPVGQGEVCCPDPGQLRVSVGLGDSCCGATPFSSAAGQICCGGVLRDGYSSQCCGGRVVEREAECCGDAGRGTAHAAMPGCPPPPRRAKAGTWAQMGWMGTGPWCQPSLSDQMMELPASEHQPEPCQGRSRLPGCNRNNGHHEEKCRPSVLCPASSASGAYCGSCDLNPAQFVCTWVPGEPDAPSATRIPSSSPQAPPAPSATAHGQLCPTPEELVYSGMANRYIFTDTELEPYTRYEYRVGAWNRHGRAFSPASHVTTKEDVPERVPPPRWSRVGIRDDVIQLDWSPPFRSNGEISHYIILRDGQERYRGNEQSFTDAGGIRPFQEYTYRLRACTSAGCADSTSVVAVTVQGVPEGLAAPSVIALGSTALHISWEAPAKPNGIIREYHINQSGVGVIHTHREGEMAYTVTGITPSVCLKFTFALETYGEL